MAGRPRVNDADRERNRINAVKKYQQSEEYRTYKKNYSKERYLNSKIHKSLTEIASHYENDEDELYQLKVCIIATRNNVKDIKEAMKDFRNEWDLDDKINKCIIEISTHYENDEDKSYQKKVCIIMTRDNIKDIKEAMINFRNEWNNP